MYYHTLIITLFSFLKTPTVSDEKAMASVSLARQICISSAHRVGELFIAQNSVYGFERMNTCYLHWIVIALFSMMDDLDNPKSHSSFVWLCKAAYAISERRAFSRAAFRLVQLMTKQTNGVIPPEILK